ncbi:MAG: OmpA family protein [Acidobacteriota bacterium]
MTSEARQSRDHSPRDNEPPGQNELTELRNLLLAPEQDQLGRLQRRLDDPQVRADDIGRVLPDAIRYSHTHDRGLATALSPVVEDGIRVSIKKDPKILIDAIFPVVGPAIRKAIGSALSAMIQSLSQTLDHSLSFRGLKWRMEALRTGKPFAEVVLLHTLVYRVEQVLLIHRETGLLLQHVTIPTVNARDADMVSGMLTAIQDFVHHSFSLEEGDILETMQVGELSVWVEPGPQAFLVGVIRGKVSQDIRSIFQDTIEAIHREQRQELEGFRGDASAFEGTRPHLESCLQSQFASQKSPSFPVPLLVLACLMLAALGFWAFISLRNYQRWNALVDRFRAEPGYVITAAERGGGKYLISGLRDPLAVEPSRILEEKQIDPNRFVGRWESYQSGASPFVLARAKALLDPPETVILSFEKGALRARGLATGEWIRESKRLAGLVPGVSQFQTDGLFDVELDRLKSLKGRVEAFKVPFGLGSLRLATGQDRLLLQIATEIRQLLRAAASLGLNVRVEAVGHADRTGSEQANRELGRKRAEAILRALVSHGISHTHLSARSVGTAEPLGGVSGDNRRVDFRVEINPPLTSN